MRLALLTGGSRGLGAALATGLRTDGWRVVEFSRSAPHSDSHALDLARSETVKPALHAALAGIEAPEALLAVHCAGDVSPIAGVGDLEAESLVPSLLANLAGGMLFLSGVVERFQALPAPKTLINISSGAAQQPFAGWAAYGAAKAGLEMFVRVLASEQASREHPFAALNIDPGVMDTAMQATIRAASTEAFPDRPRFLKFHEKGLLASPEATAAAVRRILATSPASGSRLATRDFPA